MKKISLFITVIFACMLLCISCKREEFVVTFHPNGGRGNIVSQYFNQKIAQNLLPNTFTNKEFAFSNWCISPDGNGTKYSDKESIIVSENMVLYAQWTTASGIVTVTFKPNGGYGEMKPQKMDAGIPTTIHPNEFVNENYHFMSWNTSPNGKGKNYESQQILTLVSDLTLYAQWKPAVYTFFVIFNSNEGEGTMNNQEFNFGEYHPLDSNTFIKNGFIFDGWNTKKDGSGSFLHDKQEISISSNLLLYAQWVHEKNLK